MAWTTPLTVAVGDIYTAAQYNTYTRDNLDEIWHVVAYNEYVGSLGVTSTDVNTPDVIIVADQIVASGDPCLIEFYCPELQPSPGAGNAVHIYLFQDGSATGEIARWNSGTAGRIQGPVSASARITPTAGNRTFEIRAISDVGGTFNAHGGGAANRMPGYIRVSQRGG